MIMINMNLDSRRTSFMKDQALQFHQVGAGRLARCDTDGGLTSSGYAERLLKRMAR